MQRPVAPRRALAILDLAFIGLAAYFAAQLLAGLAFGPSLPEAVPSAAKSGRAAASAGTGRVDTAAILERNLFGSRLTAAAPPGPAGEPAEAIPPSSLPLKLLGTVVNAAGKRSFAVIEDGGRGQGLFFEGDAVAEGVLLVSVARNRVVLSRGGREEVLERQADASPAPSPPVAALPSRAPAREARQPLALSTTEPAGELNVRQVADNTYVMDRREVDGVLQDFNQLLTQVRVVPHFAEGKPDGFKVFNIRPNSLFSKLGIANGDIIRRVNGLEISGPEQALQMFAQLREESRITLDLERFRKNLSLQYEIR